MSSSQSRHILAAAALFMLVPVSGALAQDDGAPGPDVVITGNIEEQTRQFVEQVTAPGTADQLARWDTSICTSIVGLPRRQGQFLADHIAQRAYSLGLQPGAPGCHGNVAVFVTDNADGMAEQLFNEDRSLFAYLPENNVSTRGQLAFDGFLNSDAPVRWWHVSRTFSADGIALSGDASTGGISNAPVARSGGSRLRSDTRENIDRVIIIVDANRVGDAQLASLADYIAMVALAQVDPRANTAGAPSILNLFTSHRNATEMTEWDLAYLNGLYSASRDAATVGQQEREITRRMLERGRQS